MRGEEDFTLADDAAHLIARLADGGMRDAISILDQCTSYAKDVTLSVVSQATGLVLQDYLFDLTDVIYRRQTADAIQKSTNFTKARRIFKNSWEI